MRKHLAVAAAALATAMAAGTSRAATYSLFAFENNEFGSGDTVIAGGGNSTAGLGGGFGVTQGTSAFVVTGAPASATIFTATVGGSATGEQLANFQAFDNTVADLQNGLTATLTFDFSYDFTNTTTGGFFQPGIINNNSGGGYQQNLAFGGLLGGNVRSFADFPAIGPNAQAGGATLTILDPVNFTTDFRGTLRMTIPVGLPGSGKPILLGRANPVSNSFYQITFNTNGGFGGTANYALDNFFFTTAAVPEPTTLAAFSAAGVVAFTRRRRVAR